ncbi:MAG: Ig-like domain repeat protein, partial [bacterium]|nr:Ig-like domain repeat protein [bacterium]
TPMSDRAEKVQFNQDATTVNATSWLWSFTGPGTITFGTPNAEDTTITANTDGIYTITLTANDGFTNSAESFQLTWDSTAPVITINPITPDPTGDSTPTFTGNATDALNNITGVEYQVDGGSWAACTAVDGTFDSNNENYTCTVSPALSEASHTVNVIAIDALGNTSDGSVSDTFTVNLSGPSITPMSDRSENALFTQNATTTGAISWTWTYTGPGVITFGTANEEDTTISASVDGTYTVTLTAADDLNNTVSSFQLIWDTTPPVITVNTPDLGTISIASLSDTSITDDNSVANILWKKISGPGSINFTDNELIANPLLSATLTGSYTVMVEAWDEAGNTASSTVEFIWSGDPATPYITNPAGGSYVAGDTAVNITWVSSGEDDLDYFKLWYSGDSGDTWNLLADDIASTTSTYSWQSPEVDSGGHLFKLAVYNLATNSTTTVSLPFFIDSTHPTSVLVTHPDALTLPVKGGSDLEITWTGGEDDHLGVTPITLEYSVSGNFDDTALIANTTNSGSYTWTVPVIATAPTARVRVTASDLAGNQSLGLSSTFAIDSLAPDVILTANFGAMAGVFTPNPTINDNIDTAGELTYAWSVVSAPAGGNVYFSVPFIANPSISGDEHGVYTLALTVTDRAGNTVTEEAIFNWQGGSIYPEVIYPSAGNYLSAGTANIVWTLAGADNILSYQVESSENSGVSWTTIATGLSNDATTTPWNISAGTNSMNNMIRVTAYDNVDTPYIANSGLFSIDSSAPVVNLTSSLGTINTATLVTASATDNFTSAGQLTYNWSVLSAPSGGNLLISSSTILTPTLAGSVNGNYSALLSVSDQAGNTATSSVAFTWYITPTGGGGGGGGGNTIIYCTQVDYSAWGTCNGGFQTRTVLSRSPLSCSLTTAQQIAVTQTCVAPELPPTEPPVVEEPIVPGTGSTYPFDPEAVDVIELARQNFTKVDTNLVKSVIGRIVLQVEDRGRAWYINPKDNHKYYLGRPTNAFQVMRILGDGILTSNLDKIPVGIIDGSLTMDVDSDKDGLPDRLEEGLRTDPFKKDTDGDGFSDYEEVKNGYDPLSGGKPKTDLAFTKKNNGRIFIQVQQNGEAWYVDPISQRRYYLGRPVEALAIMRMLSLGISNEDINKIPVGSFSGIVK